MILLRRHAFLLGLALLPGCSLLMPETEPTPATAPPPKPAPAAAQSAPNAAAPLAMEATPLAPQGPAGAADTQRLMRDYVRAIQTKIRAGIKLPKGLKGNPEAVFKVQQDAQGRIHGKPVLTRSSGNKALDAAIGRAIASASPLPPPPRPDLFYPSLELAVRPRG